MVESCCFALFTVVLSMTCVGSAAALAAGTFNEINSFTISKSPSGMFFYEAQGLLYILCGTQTNGDHYIYAYTVDGTEKCFITIPSSSKMARVDGFYIVGSTAYIVDSQGPMHSGSLGGSLYAVEWSNPCECNSGGTCSSSSTNWSPTVKKMHVLDATSTAIGDGGGTDSYFRNSGIVVVGDHFYAVNGVHPISRSYTSSYPKSLVKVANADTSISQKWSFTGSTLGHDVDMEGITCGSDKCSNYLYIGDEYNYIYKLNLATADPAAAVEIEWNVNSAVGNVAIDKGIESLTFASTTGYFYAGIQGTSKIHVFELIGADSASTAGPTTQAPNAGNSTTQASNSGPGTTGAPTTSRAASDPNGVNAAEPLTSCNLAVSILPAISMLLSK